MRITESQLRKVVRQEILREADLRGATFDDMEPSLVDLVDFAENNELFEHPFTTGYAMDLVEAYLDEELGGMAVPQSWKASAVLHLEAEHDRRFR